MKENEGKVTCPYCEEEQKKIDEQIKKYPGRDVRSWYQYICYYCNDTHLIDWVDAIIKPISFGTSGTSGPIGKYGTITVPKNSSFIDMVNLFFKEGSNTS